VKHRLRARHYYRYVDDFIVLSRKKSARIKNKGKEKEKCRTQRTKKL
jgi:hypothetical protein